MWGMLERLGVAGIVDEAGGVRRADAQASVGIYIALAVANRLVDPCSKLAFAKWWAKTAGDRWVRLPAGAFDHRRFWNAIDAISDNQLKEIERRLVTRMVEVFGVDLSGLVLDMTNFATYIDSANDRAPIAQRDHAKPKRTDLRLVGLGLVVSTDGGIPLVSHAYSRQPPRCHPVPRDGQRTRRPLRCDRRRCGRTHPRLRRRPGRSARVAFYDQRESRLSGDGSSCGRTSPASSAHSTTSEGDEIPTRRCGRSRQPSRTPQTLSGDAARALAHPRQNGRSALPQRPWPATARARRIRRSGVRVMVAGCEPRTTGQSRAKGLLWLYLIQTTMESGPTSGST